ncbi:MAG: methyltransferase domain-containing protein [Actinomycetota bacterium]|nr:methyltransferase domain-containing protein [Actinomycetota bacterium]
MTIANVEMAAAWDGAEGDHWAAHADRYEATAPGYWQALLRAVPIRPDQTIVDVGCGTGRSTRDLARMVPSGSVLGVDLSAKMLERARVFANAEGLANATFEQVDAQVYPFPEAAFDLAISVFGAMFFADPVAAFVNIGRSLRPGGGLALLAWRDLLDNEWVAGIREALSLGRTFPLPTVGAPGPFALADRDHTAGILSQAGYVDVRFDQVDEPIHLGDNADDAFSFVSTFGITRGLTHDLDDAGRAAALEALRASLVAHETGDGVLFSGSAWLVTAEWAP